MGVIRISSDDYDKKVLASKLPVLVKFYADWCGACQIFAPTYEAVSKDFDGKAVFTEVNVETDRDIAAEHEVRSIPTTLFLKSGKVKNTELGALSKDILKSKVQEFLD